MKEKIAIIGAGKIGTAIKTILDKKKREVKIWDKEPLKLKEKTSLPQVISQAQIIFLCIPSWANRKILQDISHYLTEPKKLIITLAKGIEKKDCKTMDQVLEEELTNKADYGILAGPMIAQEIEEYQPTIGIIALSNKKWSTTIAELFNQTNLKIVISEDLKGVGINSALKNIYTLTFGIIEGLNFKANFKGYLMVQILEEMEAITLIFNGDPKITQGLSGVGDLFTNTNNNFSYNRTLGKEIALMSFQNKNLSADQKIKQSEGTVSLQALNQYLGHQIKNFKILALTKKIILDKKNPKQEFSKLLKELSISSSINEILRA